MAENKTKPTRGSVEKFLNSIKDAKVRRDTFALLEIYKQVTKEEPKMWGTSIVGFGQYHYEYASGREGDSPLAAFSPRKQNLTLYITPEFDSYGELLGRLGKYTTGKVCLYIKTLDDVHLPTLKRLIRESVKHARSLKWSGRTSSHAH
ncbi:MAG: DUF1801 domain-containing protein [Anaerolineales bacterium]